LGYRPYQKTQLPRERKTIRVKAGDGSTGREKIDAGNYFYCWNCGFVCDIRRDDLSEGRHGVTYSVSEETAVMPDTAIEGSSQITITGRTSLRKVDAAGDAVGVKVQYTRRTSGCPLCGTRAWKK